VSIPIDQNTNKIIIRGYNVWTTIFERNLARK
jgi:hypothetical protein